MERGETLEAIQNNCVLKMGSSILAIPAWSLIKKMKRISGLVSQSHLLVALYLAL